MATFKAVRIDKADKGTTATLTQFDEAELMDGDVTVRVEWSTLNYKDGLAITGKAPVVRRFPMIAGIDFAGQFVGIGNCREIGSRIGCREPLAYSRIVTAGFSGDGHHLSKDSRHLRRAMVAALHRLACLEIGVSQGTQFVGALIARFRLNGFRRNR